MSIKQTLQIWIITFILVPLVTVSVISYATITKKVLELQADHMEQLVETNATGLETLILSQKDELELLSTRSEVYSLLQLDDIDSDSNYSMNSILRQRKYTNSSCEELSLYDLHQNIIASSNSRIVGSTNSDNSDNTTLNYMASTKQPACAVSGILVEQKKSTDNLRYIEIGHPIYSPSDESEVLGYLVSKIRLSYFDSFLENLHLGRTGTGFVLDYNGTVIYDTNNIYTDNVIPSSELKSLYSEFYKGNIDDAGTFTFMLENKKQLCSYRIVSEVDWIVVMKQEYSEINNLSSVILLTLIYGAILIFIVVNVFIHAFSKSFTAPIFALRDAMRKASNGDLSVQTNITQNNELGELSKSFNKMIHIIKTNYDDLTSMHDELLINEEQLRNNYEHIEFLAYHDTLTSLPNKLAYSEQVGAVLSASENTDKKHAIMFVDLDNFKTVNDTLGHEYGDALLARTSSILRSMIRKEDMLARAGGDEFLIFLNDITGSDLAIEIATGILRTFKEPIQINNEELYVSASIGISMYPKNGTAMNTLIKNADIAMYHSKDTGKNKVTLFNKRMEDELNRNTLILDILRTAIANDEVFLMYQPQFDIISKHIIGYETLMRIRNSKLGYLSPTEFIPIAEECGLIVELGEWALIEACKFNKDLLDKGKEPCPISVNISSIQINQKDFIHTIKNALEVTKLPPHLLELEITESTLVSTVVDANELFTSLVQLGVRISLDDFGTGYSSLNYLTRIPINTLKIDKSFIDNICSNTKDCCVAETIIRLAHNLDIRVIAEGVEYEDQLEILKNKSCDVVQGFIYSKPLMQEDLVALLNVDHEKKDAKN